MNELELRQMFKNLSDCYADTRSFGDDGSYIEGEVIQAMTEDRFIEVLNEVKELLTSDVNSLFDLDGKIVPVKFKVSKYEPKIINK
jgi:hypothetical protein